MFYGVVVSDWHGFDWDGLEEVFCDEDMAEEYANRIWEERYYDMPEYSIDVCDMTEEEVKKYWGEQPIPKN